MTPTGTMPGRTAARWFCGIIVIAFLWWLAVVLVPRLRWLEVPTLYALVPVGVVALVLAVVFRAAGRTSAPAGARVAGWAVIIGGSAADIFATVWHSPTLTREANPILRGLLDSGHSLALVYGYALVIQALGIVGACVTWDALLRHRKELAALMPAAGSLLAYFKAGTGGRHLSYRQWLCPLRWNDLPEGYAYACWAGACGVGICLARFYAAAEWYRIVLPTASNRVIAGGILLLLLCVSYAAWLRSARRALPEPESDELPVAEELDP
jgi:hypothetical protein